jgi:fructose-1,6-bisphosphatase/inositol monophosphatase family enzyme
MSKVPDPQKVADIIQDVAVNIIEPRFQKLQDHEVQTKTGPSDLVTIADIEAEEALEKYLCDLIPGSIAMGEEAVSRGEKDTADMAQDETYWVIDPVDGTNNFRHGRPKFGCMVALVHHGETVQSWIYHIPRKIMSMGEKGAGAAMNDSPIHIDTTPSPLKQSDGFISVFYAPKEIKAVVQNNQDKLGDVQAHMCCAHEYTLMLEGQASYAMYTRTKPWDHLAGALLLEEAGAFVKKWDKTPFTARSHDKGILAATSEQLWDDMYALVLANFVTSKKI